MKEALSDLTIEELRARFPLLPTYRAEQLFVWLQKGARFSDMLNLPAALRGELSEKYEDRPAEIAAVYESKIDDTKKLLFSLADGECVEGVLMRHEYGRTLCLSTQAGCRMGCAFCASTLEGLSRSLTAAEMLGQAQRAREILPAGERLSHIVLMGSGEPFDNYENVTRFLRLVSHEKGLNIGLRHISLSTCGLTPMIEKFSDEGLPVTLSVSLHAPSDEIRQRLMPVAKAYPMEGLLAACREYVKKTGRRAVFEYALVENVNSLPENARELASKLRGFQCHVNLIPLNRVPERGLMGASPEAVQLFMKTLENAHISVTVRRSMGADIGGACGQLRRSVIKEGGTQA